MIEESVTVVSPAIANSPLYAFVTRLLLSLWKVFQANDDARSVAARRLFQFIFDYLSTLCNRLINSTTSISTLLDRIALLLESFRKSSSNVKQARVKFASTEVESGVEPSNDNAEINSADSGNYLTEKAQDLISSLCGQCVAQFNSTTDIAYIKLLSRLLKAYMTNDLICQLAAVTTVSGDFNGVIRSEYDSRSNVDPAVTFMESVVVPWLKHPQAADLLSDIVIVLYDKESSARQALISRLLEVIIKNWKSSCRV